MNDHRDMQENAPAFLAGRLEREERKRFEEHLSTCGACRDLVADLEPVARAWRERGIELLEPCPSSLTLMEVARRSAEDPGGAVARHAETCETCSLEFEIWNEPGRKTVRFPRRAVSRPVLYRWAGMAAAAGLALGLGLPFLIQDGAVAPPQAPGAVDLPWSGPVNLYTLDGTLRGEGEQQIFSVDRSNPVIPLVLLPAVPDTAAGDDLFRFMITAEDGGLAWSIDLSKDRITSYLDTSAVLTLMVPEDRLPAGGYTLAMLAGVDPGAEVLMEERFRIE